MPPSVWGGVRSKVDGYRPNTGNSCLRYHETILHACYDPTVSTTADLVAVLKKELKSAQVTYADLARGLGLAESSVKRMFARGDMPLSRIDAICRVLHVDFAELSRRVADAQPLMREMTQEQEKAVVADKKLLLCAI